MYLEEFKSVYDLDYAVEKFFPTVFMSKELDYFKKTVQISLDKKAIENSEFEDICYYFIKTGPNSQTIGMIGYYTSKKRPKETWIGWFGILPEYRRQGFGTKALNSLIRLLNVMKMNCIRVWTSEIDNQEAMGFYSNRLFIQDSRMHDGTVTFKRGLLKIPENWHGKPIGFYSL